MASEEAVSQTPRMKMGEMNLYLTFRYDTWLWGITPFAPRSRLKTVMVGDVSALVPEIVCNWDMCPGASVDDFPYGTGIFQVDSKFYVVGGPIKRGCPPEEGLLCEIPFDYDDSRRKSPVEVNEFTPPNYRGPPHEIAYPFMSSGYLAPIIAKINGEVYVFYDCKKSFYVFDKGSRQLKALPAPPFLNLPYGKVYWGVVFDKLCVRVSNRRMFRFDAGTRMWHEDGDKMHYPPCGAITLSSLRWRMEGCNYSVFISADMSFEGDHFFLIAALVDELGYMVWVQDMSEAIPEHKNCVLDYKVVEVENDDSQGQGQGCSTFCLVFNTTAMLLGLSLVRVSFISTVLETLHKEKKQKTSSPEATPSSSADMVDFLKVEYLDSRLYTFKLDLNDSVIDAAFIC